MNLSEALKQSPLVAILRGISPGEAEEIGDILIDAGFRMIEVPLNSPQPFDSIERLARRFGDSALIGAGTVVEHQQVKKLADSGGRLMVSPNFDAGVVSTAKAAGMVALPGVATPTEAFAALRAGADGLKLFPAEMMPPSVVRAMVSVLPKGAILLPVGGITPDNMAPYRAAGAAGFGIGSALYKPGVSIADLKATAKRFVDAARG